MIPKATMALQPFKSSLATRIFLICFVSVHVPLIAVIVSVASGMSEASLGLFGLLLGATLVGTVACIFGLWHLLRPLRTLTTAVRRYHEDGTPLRLKAARHDEIGLLTSAVSAMVLEVDSLMHDLRQQAQTDTLTGLGNRRWLIERFAQEVARAERQSEPLSVVLLDLDNFKSINDRHGHDTGDQVLVAAGELIMSHVRPYDLAARIGGEEFCIILPKTNAAEATVIAERLRERFARTLVAPLRRGRMTASFGVYESSTGENLQHMLQRADIALYSAKHSGRNCVRLARSDAETGNSDVRASDITGQQGT